MKTWQTSQTDPEILQEIIARDKVILSLRIQSALFQFDGHFPNRPILPGVAQLDWAVRYARHYFNISRPVKDISQIKFRQLITPDTIVSFTLEYDQSQSYIEFCYQNDSEVFSSGRINLGEA